MLSTLVALVASITPSLDPDFLVGEWSGHIDYPAWVVADASLAYTDYEAALPQLRTTVAVTPVTRGVRALAFSMFEPTEPAMRKNYVVASLALAKLGIGDMPRDIPVYEKAPHPTVQSRLESRPYGIQSLEGGTITYHLSRQWPDLNGVVLTDLVLRFHPIDANSVVMHAFLPEHDNRLIFSFYLHRIEGATPARRSSE